MMVRSIAELKRIPDRRIQTYLEQLQETLVEELPLEPAPTLTLEQAPALPLEQAPALPQPRTVSVQRELAALGIKIAVIVIAFSAIFTFLYGLQRNTDPDMVPMVKTGDLLLFYRLDKDYAIGDLLLLDFQGESQIRRVVARAGDTVDIQEGHLIINGAAQQEPGIFEETWPYENEIEFPLTVGPNQVFVLGDARENATDSRVYGPVDTRDTLGTVITVLRRRSL